MPGPGMELIGEEEKRELLEVLEAGYLFRYGSPDNPAFKAKVYHLEQEVARLVGVRHAVAVNSGTTALLVALAGLGVGPGDEVIVPGYTFIASMSSVIYARAIPILAEIDRTFNLDPADVRRKITPRTKAIMAVHMLGNPARLDELKAIADEHNLLLIEDCAQAFGASYKGRRVGPSAMPARTASTSSRPSRPAMEGWWSPTTELPTVASSASTTRGIHPYVWGSRSAGAPSSAWIFA